jgi:hypothetical protein
MKVKLLAPLRLYSHNKGLAASIPAFQLKSKAA